MAAASNSFSKHPLQPAKAEVWHLVPNVKGFQIPAWALMAEGAFILLSLLLSFQLLLMLRRGYTPLLENQGLYKTKKGGRKFQQPRLEHSQLLAPVPW